MIGMLAILYFVGVPVPEAVSSLSFNDNPSPTFMEVTSPCAQFPSIWSEVVVLLVFDTRKFPCTCKVA